MQPSVFSIFVTLLLIRYLTMVDPSQMVFLEDGTKTVISLPPLTNSETTKVIIIIITTTTILVILLIDN